MAIKFPHGAHQSYVLTSAGTGTYAIDEIKNAVTIVDCATTQGTGNRTLTVTTSDTVEIGSVMYVITKTSGTQDHIFSTGFTANNHTGVTGKIFVHTFIYTANGWYKAGEQQIN